MFAFISDALALIRLRRTLLAYLSCKLTYNLLVDTVNDDLVGLGNIELDSVCFLNNNRMRVTEVKSNLVAALCSTITNALDLESLGVTVCNTLYQVRDKSSCKTVK